MCLSRTITLAVVATTARFSNTRSRQQARGLTGPTQLVYPIDAPRGIAVSSDGKTVYVVINTDISGNGQINSYDATTGLGGPLIKKMGGRPWGLAASASNLFVTLTDANAVGKYNFNTGVY